MSAFGPSTPRSPYTGGGPAAAMWSGSSSSGSTPPPMRRSPSKWGSTSPSTPRTLMRRIACMSERQKICLMIPFSLYICYSIYCDLLVYFAPRSLPFPPEIHHQNAKQQRNKFQGPDLWSIATITFNPATPSVVQLSDNFGMGNFGALMSSHGRRTSGANFGNFGLQSDTTTTIGPNGLSLFPDAERPVDPNNPLDKKVQKPHSLPKGCDWDTWQTTVHPTCNNVHTMPMLDLVLEDSVQAPGLPSFFFGGSRLTGIYRSPDESLLAYKTLRPEMIFGEREHQKAMVEAIAYEQYSPAAVGIFDQCAVSFVTEFADGGVLPEHIERVAARQCDTDEIRSCQTECISGPDTNECRGDANCEKSCLYECCYGRGERRSNSTLASDAISGDDLRLAIDLTSIVLKLHEHHSTPLIHRDLDPANVIFVDGRAKVIDFNEGRVIPHRLNENDGKISTSIMPAPVPCYPKGIPVGDNIDDKPLEIIEQDVVNEKVDVYQLGALFFYILTRGARVYHCENPKGMCTWGDRHENSIPDEQVRQMKKEGIVPSLPKYIAESEDEFIRAIVYNMEAAMHHNASQRPTAKSIMESLTAAIESKPYYHATGSSGENVTRSTKITDGSRATAYIHVGPRKTGSTTIQDLFAEEGLDKALHEDGIATIKGQTLARCIQDAVKPGRKTNSSCDKTKMDHLRRKIDKIRNSGQNLLFSCESIDMLQSDEEFRLLRSTFTGFDIHIIVVYRRFFEWLPSLFAQQYRTVPGEEFDYVTWTDTPKTEGLSLAAFLRQKKHFSPRRTYERYVGQFSHRNVSFVSPYTSSGGGNLASAFFCLKQLRASRTCSAVSIPRKNSGKNLEKPLEYDMIAMAAKDQGIVEAKSISRVDLRRIVQMRQEGVLNRTASDFPRRCPSQKIKSSILNISLDDEDRVVATLTPTGFQLDALAHEDSFEAKWKSKFCLVNTDAILSRDSWRKYLSQSTSSTSTKTRSSEIDFFVAGFPKCGTTSLLKTLMAHEEVIMPKHEQCIINKERYSVEEAFNIVVSEIDKIDTGLMEKKRVRGGKCPMFIWNSDRIETLARSFGAQKIVVGVRHPILFFQSFYNYRVTEFHQNAKLKQNGELRSPPPPESLIGQQNQWKDVSTFSAQYEKALKSFIPSGDSSVKFFIYAAEQLEGGASPIFRNNLKDFLGLERPIKAIGHSNKNHALERKLPFVIDICNENYSGLRALLTKNAIDTSRFLLDGFVHERNVDVGDIQQFRALLESWSEDPCLVAADEEANTVMTSERKQRHRTGPSFDWDIVNFSRNGLCGGYKCFFSDFEDQSIGYLFSRNIFRRKDEDWGNEFDDGWKISQYLEKSIGLRHTLLGPPQRVPVTSSSPLLNEASLQTVRLSKNYTVMNTNQVYQNGHVVVQRVRAAPRHSKFIKSGHASSYTKGLLDGLLAASSNKSQFLENLSRQVQEASILYRVEPLLAIDYQIIIDTEGTIYHIDLDRIFTNHDIYQHNDQFIPRLQQLHKQCFDLFANIERWIESMYVDTFNARSDLDLHLPEKPTLLPQGLERIGVSQSDWEVEGETSWAQKLRDQSACFAREHASTMYRRAGNFDKIPQGGLSFLLVTDLIQRLIDDGFYEETEGYQCVEEPRTPPSFFYPSDSILAGRKEKKLFSFPRTFPPVLGEGMGVVVKERKTEPMSNTPSISLGSSDSSGSLVCPATSVSGAEEESICERPDIKSISPLLTCSEIHGLDLYRAITKTTDQTNDGEDRWIMNFKTQGGTRSIWELTDSANESLFVLKMPLLIDKLFGQKKYENAWTDALVMESLSKSPYILNLYGFCALSSIGEFAGNSLSSALRDSDSERKLGLATDIAQGVADLHGVEKDERIGLGIVHNDISSSNFVLVNPDGPVKLNDFNAAKVQCWRNQDKGSCGYYSSEKFGGGRRRIDVRAPEELLGGNVLTEKIDVYGLGSILYFILTDGKRMYSLEDHELNDEEKRDRILSSVPPTMPTNITNTASRSIGTMRLAMEKALQIDPLDRPSAQELAEILRRAH